MLPIDMRMSPVLISEEPNNRSIENQTINRMFYTNRKKSYFLRNILESVKQKSGVNF